MTSTGADTGAERSGPDVLVERQGAVMVLRLNRPERHNAIGGTLLRDLAAAFEEAAADDDVRVVVTTGVGRSFCVGADAGALSGGVRPAARDLLSGTDVGGETGLRPLTERERSMDDLGNAGRWTQRMWALEKPTIAAVNGAAVGGGFGIALLHDVLLAGASARLGTGFAPIGLAPELGISLLLPRIVGYASAAELLFTGRVLDAEEGRALRLVSEVVADDVLLERALEVAARIAAVPPLGVLASKRLLRASMGRAMTDQLRAEYATHRVLFDDPDTHRAMDELAERLRARRPADTARATPVEEGSSP